MGSVASQNEGNGSQPHKYYATAVNLVLSPHKRYDSAHHGSRKGQSSSQATRRTGLRYLQAAEGEMQWEYTMWTVQNAQKRDGCQYTVSKALVPQTPPKSQQLLRDSSFDQENSVNEIESFLDRPIEDYAHPDAPIRGELSALASATPIPKFSRMLRDEKGRFISPPWQ
jgi:hypothetical protein